MAELFRQAKDCALEDLPESMTMQHPLYDWQL
jgi:hypothetical protein